MKFKAFNMTAQGASHIKRNKECQDASQSYTSENGDYAVAVVCDGHGGNDYIRSRYGSEKASEIALKNIKEFITCANSDELKRRYDVMLNSLASSIIAEWGADVRQHWKSNPITNEEEALLSEKAKKRYLQDHKVESAYGTTLLAIAFTKDYWFGMQVGDGKCVGVDPESTILQAIELDKKCFLNATTSLCDSDALERFHYCFGDILPAAVFVGSDGIDDCFKNDAQLYNFYRTVSYSFGSNDFESAYDELKDFLPRLSQKGSGDDVSIAGILNMDVLPEIDIVKSFNREEEKAKKQKAEEEEARRNAEIKAEYERKAAEIRKRKEEEERRRLEYEELKRLEKEKQEKAQKEERLSRIESAINTAKLKIANIANELFVAKNNVKIAKDRFDLAYDSGSNNRDNCYEELKKKEKIASNLALQHSEAQKELGQRRNELSDFVHDFGAICPKCGTIMLADVRFCSKCGNDMSAEPEDIILDKSKSSTEDVKPIDNLEYSAGDVKSANEPKSTVEETKPVDVPKSAAEDVKSIDNTESSAEDVKPVDEPKSVVEGVKSVDDLKSVAEEVKPADEPKSVAEDVKPVDETKSIAEKKKPSEEEPNCEEVVESTIKIDFSIKSIPDDRFNDAGLALLELFKKKF